MAEGVARGDASPSTSRPKPATARGRTSASGDLLGADAGVRLLIDDGKLVLRVAKINRSFETVVEVGGPLSSRKGVNLPDMIIDSPPLTEKDKSDLAFALDAGVDWVALSFVQRANDILDARR